MSYNTKYKVEFEDRNDNDIVINLKKLNYIGSFQILKATNNPITISYLDSDVFDSVKTAGASIKLISESDRQLIELYTANYKEWQVEVLKNNSIIFNGYLSAEMYSESFAESFNYDVNIEANNGIGILSREKYIKSDNTNYRGVTNVFQVIKNCIDKIGISYESINIATDLKINNSTPSTDKTVLQHLTINNDNYIDEDGIVMNCMEVLETVLKPLNLSLFIENNKVYVVDFKYLKNETIVLKKFLYNSSTCTNHSLNIVRDLNTEVQVNSSFDINAGVNNYIVTVNRYVKNIIEKIDFNENFEGDDNANVTSLTNKNIWDLSTSTSNDRFWLNKVDGFQDYYIRTNTTLPNTSITYFNNSKIAHAGGIKPHKIVDGTLINYSVDDETFEKYIFIQNPYKSWSNSKTIPQFEQVRIAYNHYEYDLNTIAYKAFNYTVKSPLIYNSTDTLIQLNFTANIVSTAILAALGNYGAPVWKALNTVNSSYGYFHYFTKVLFKDENGVIKYFLRLKGSENYNINTVMPMPKDYEYELVEYTGQTFTYCIIAIANINEAGNEVPIFNEDVEIKLDIPVTFDNTYYLDVEFWNMWYRVSNNTYGIDFVNQGSHHYTPNFIPQADFKQSLPHLAIKDIYTKLIDKKTGEEISLSDEENQYYLSEQYKTNEIKDEFKHYTATKKYITDVGGITYNNQYITDANTLENLEDLKGEKMIKQYESNNINLSIDIQSDTFSMLQLFKLNSDPIWSNKKWVMASMENNVVANEINLKLKELF